MIKKEYKYVYQTSICNYCDIKIKDNSVIYMCLSKEFCSEKCRKNYQTTFFFNELQNSNKR